MKHFIFPLIIGILFSFGNKEKNLENKLLEVYSSEQTKSILKDENRKKYFETLIFNSFLIEEIENKKLQKKSYPPINSISLNEKNGSINKIGIEKFLELIKNGNFNPLKLNLERDLNEKKSYRLGKTNTIFHLLSYNQINKLAKK